MSVPQRWVRCTRTVRPSPRRDGEVASSGLRQDTRTRPVNGQPWGTAGYAYSPERRSWNHDQYVLQQAILSQLRAHSPFMARYRAGNEVKAGANYPSLENGRMPPGRLLDLL